MPPLVIFLCKNPIVDKFDLSALTSINVGAAPLGKELTKALLNKFPQVTVRQGNCIHIRPTEIPFSPPQKKKWLNYGDAKLCQVKKTVGSTIWHPKTNKFVIDFKDIWPNTMACPFFFFFFFCLSFFATEISRGQPFGKNM